MPQQQYMTSPANTQDAGLLRLRTLVRLRWLAVAGQLVAVIFVHFVLNYPLPLIYCSALIALSAWINIWLTLRWKSPFALPSREAAMMLGYDIVQLAGLLYLTGGLENPFAFLFLVPVTVSAASLPVFWTALLCALAFALVTLLSFFHMPLPWDVASPLVLPTPYVAGMWATLVSGTLFSGIYARRIAVEARQMSTALNAAELVLAREQRLSALDGLAAAAAHELGTPLATIALVAKELRLAFPKNSPHTEDLDLLMSQAARCREILSRLAKRDQLTEDDFAHDKLTVMIENLIAPLRGPDVNIVVVTQGNENEPILKRNPAISYGLGNLLENAADFAKTTVTIKPIWSEKTVTLEVEDDGPGFDILIFDRLGDPFITTRPGYTTTHAPEDSKTHEGMGLGLFIAKTLLERSGATVSLSNRLSPATGARVKVSWSRATIDSELAVSQTEKSTVQESWI